jgi:glycosyltransferase involved in cell wall biosynthesis
MPTSPKVSVITPTYNRAGFLAETIESVLGQGYPDLEYILLDDGSTDDTPAVIEKYGDRLTFISHANMGEALTVNEGLAMARGEIVGVVNSDDPILPGLVEHAVEAFTNDESLLVVYPDWRMIDHASNAIKEVEAHEYSYLNMVRWHRCLVGPGAFIRRKALLLEPLRNPGYRHIGDFEYWLRLGLHGPFARIPKTLATHRVHPVSASAERGEDHADEHIRLISELYSRPDLPPAVLRVQKEAFSNAAYLAGRTCMATSLPRARHYFLESLKHDPTSYLRWRPARLAMILIAFLPEKLSSKVRLLGEQAVKSPMYYYESL